MASQQEARIGPLYQPSFASIIEEVSSWCESLFQRQPPPPGACMRVEVQSIYSGACQDMRVNAGACRDMRLDVGICQDMQEARCGSLPGNAGG